MIHRWSQGDSDCAIDFCVFECFGDVGLAISIIEAVDVVLSEPTLVVWAAVFDIAFSFGI